jgi:hypothetical protein
VVNEVRYVVNLNKVVFNDLNRGVGGLPLFISGGRDGSYVSLNVTKANPKKACDESL